MSYFALLSEEHDLEVIFELAVEAGADDIQHDDELIEIYGAPSAFKSIADQLTKANITPEESGVRYVPKQEVSLDVEATIKVMKAIEAIEDLDDVQNVYANLDVSAEAIQALENE